MQQLVRLLLAVALLASAPVTWAKSSKIVVALGDSLTDNGNLFKSDGGKIPSPKVYWKGRFTNGPGTWADQLPSADRRLQVANFAYGGALACKYTELPAPLNAIPALDEQVQLFNMKRNTDKAFGATLKGKTVIPAIWIGHNDIQALTLVPKSLAATIPARTVQCIVNATAALLTAGFKTVVIGNLAPIDQTPLAFQNNITGQLNMLVAGINAGIQAGVAGLNAKFPNQTIVLWDVNLMLAGAITNYKKLGFKHNSTESCIVGGPDYSAVQGTVPQSICKHPNDYLFYDHEHGTAKSHKIIAKDFVGRLLTAKILKPAHRHGKV